jgi:hypothetical protein
MATPQGPVCYTIDIVYLIAKVTLFLKRFLVPTSCVLIGTIGVIGGSFLSPAMAFGIGSSPNIYNTLDPIDATLVKGLNYTSWLVQNRTGRPWTHFTLTSNGAFKFTPVGKYPIDIPLPVGKPAMFNFSFNKTTGLPQIPNGNIVDIFGLFTATEGGKTGTITVAQDTIFTGTPSVPGPLPILGIVSAFGFSRKLRKRIKLSNEASVTVAGNN